ncbi:MAG: pyridoxamine 5'-phosphate oxidase [Kineosporiaceae bacterium]
MTSVPPLDDLAGTRVAYTSGTLSEADLAPSPLEQFERWYADARRAAGDGRLVEPNAMTLATAGADGLPAARTVLLKGVGSLGFEFFTHLSSRKARAIRERGGVALLLPWVPLQRQVAVLGSAEELPRDRVAEYFRSRPYGSRIGALTSRQSEVVASRAEIDAAAAATSARYPDTGSPDDVPVPDGWGGYRVRPVEVEFWQGRASRLHDRLVFLARSGRPASLDDPAAWRVERRWP